MQLQGRVLKALGREGLHARDGVHSRAPLAEAELVNHQIQDHPPQVPGEAVCNHSLEELTHLVKKHD